jgi:hypothetical protein
MPQYQGVWNLQDAARLQSQQQWVTDPNFRNTTLLLQADNAANSAQNNTFLDSSSNSFAITRNGNTTQGTFTPFSQGWSNYFNGANSDGIEIPNNAVFNFGTGDVTIEFWVNLTSTSAIQNLIECAPSGGSGFTSWNLDITASGYIRMNSYVAGNYQALETTTNNLFPNQWYHVAYTRSSGTNRIFINGALATATGTFTQAIDSGGNTVTIGRGKYTGFTRPTTGYISNVRITKGGALYTSNFNPSTTPFTTTVSAGTVSLLTCQSNRFIDNSVNTFAITVLATPSVQPFAPFAPQFQYTQTGIGGSGYFDGNADYLTGSAPLVQTASTSTFTFEGWIYPTTFANQIYLFGDMTPTAGTFAIGVQITTGGIPQLYWFDGAGKTCSGAAMVLNQWNYFAFVVNANAITAYVNSATASQSGTTTLTNRTGTSNFAVGQWNNSTTPNAYISNLRFSTVARTISAVPTAPYTADANTRVLLNFTNAGIIDGTMDNVLETVGNAQVSTSVVKYGSGSMYFDGSGDYLNIPTTNQSLTFGSANWTIEFWLYLPSLPSTRQELLYLNSNTSGYAAVALHICSNNKLGLSFSESGGSWKTDDTTGVGSALTAATWQYVAVTRSGQNIQIYLDGTAQGSAYTTTAATTSLMTTYTLNQVGAYNSASFQLNAYIDDLRITNGVARYLSNFTPPQVALPRQ